MLKFGNVFYPTQLGMWSLIQAGIKIIPFYYGQISPIGSLWIAAMDYFAFKMVPGGLQIEGGGVSTCITMKCPG